MSSTSVSEAQIVEALRQTPRERWGEILAFVTDRRTPVAHDNAPAQWTAAELLKLPLARREAILVEQAARAESDYANDPELTAFDAYGEDDLHVDSSDTQTR
jgi:hypothetical protein